MEIQLRSGDRAVITLLDGSGCYYDITTKGDEIRIRKSGFLDDQLTIFTEASNSIKIK